MLTLELQCLQEDCKQSKNVSDTSDFSSGTNNCSTFDSLTKEDEIINKLKHHRKIITLRFII